MSDFYFIASKLVGFFLDPLHILAVLVGLAALCNWLGRLRTLANTMLILWTALLGVTPLWNSLLFDLETQIKRAAPDQISGIILLGGAIDELTTEAHDDVTLNSAAERMTATLGLMRLYPDAPVIFTGFSGRLVRGKLSESDVALRFFKETIGSTERILLENRSRNTIENARYTKELTTFTETGPWLLVTSASHMPRAFEIFSDHQIDVMSYPTDFRSNHSDSGFGWSLAKGASQLKILMHEWIGITVYRLTQKP